CPVRATVLGIGKVAPHEYPHLAFRYIDVVLPEGIGQARGTVPTGFETVSRTRCPQGASQTGASPVPTEEERIIEQLVADLQARPSDSMVAYRGPHRWVPCLEPVQLGEGADERGQNHKGLRQQGVYLITGGLGEIGLSIASDLASRVKA